MSFTVMDLIERLPPLVTTNIMTLVIGLWLLGHTVRKNIIAIQNGCELLKKDGVFTEKAVEVKGNLSLLNRFNYKFKSIFYPIVILNPTRRDCKFADWVIIPNGELAISNNHLNEDKVGKLSDIF